MGVTTNFSFPYPGLTDSPDGPTQVEALANAIDAELETIVAGLPAAEIAVTKAGNTSLTSTTTLTADPDLAFGSVIAANTNYRFEGVLVFEGGSSGGFKMQLVPSAGTLRYQNLNPDANLATVYSTDIVTLTTTGASNLRIATIRGFMLNGTGSAVSLVLNWAQGTSSGTATILHAGSWLTLRKIP